MNQLYRCRTLVQLFPCQSSILRLHAAYTWPGFLPAFLRSFRLFPFDHSEPLPFLPQTACLKQLCQDFLRDPARLLQCPLDQRSAAAQDILHDVPKKDALDVMPADRKSALLQKMQFKLIEGVIQPSAILKCKSLR